MRWFESSRPCHNLSGLIQPDKHFQGYIYRGVAKR